MLHQSLAGLSAVARAGTFRHVSLVSCVGVYKVLGGGGERFGSDVGLRVYNPACYLCGLWISCSVT